ncbi:MAG: response regulator transcription factor [Clostridia bacterium]|nr:response regulator transcription factor [Clostridia bacterium]
MYKPLIYVVEDDEGICEVYEGAFEESYQTEIFNSGKDFFNAFSTVKPDIIILDIMLPDMDGYTILTRIRETDERVPVIIVSAKSDEISFVKGLNKGADDYMSKPFSILELLARVKTNLRRAGLYFKSAGCFSVDNNTYKILFKDNDLKLTLKEFKLFKILIGRSGITVDREELFKEVWGEDFMGETRTLDTHIATLRDKIKAAGGNSDAIITVRGVGYRFEPL